jgi:hypothetical protein
LESRFSMPCAQKAQTMPLTVTLTLSVAHAEEKRPVANVTLAPAAINLRANVETDDFMMKFPMMEC